MVKSIVMTKPSAVPKVTDFERVERNQLFADFEQQALRVSRECSDSPYGDLPATEYNLFANLITVLSNAKLNPRQAAFVDERMPVLKQCRPRGVGSFSLRMFTFNNNLGYATFYERREKGTGYYWRLRTVKEHQDKPEPALIITDYAVKSTAPNRSINWLVATRSAKDDFLFEREDGPGTNRSEEWSYRTWAGTDLMPGNFHPRNAEDYQRVKLRLLEATTILGKIGRLNAISDLSYVPVPVALHLANPVVYRMLGPKL